MTTTKTHIWTEAGLGQAPFRVVRLETREDRAGIESERKSNGQTYTTNHCTTCDACGTAIYNAYHIQSSDGRRFKVGCDCLEKTGSKGLIDQAKREARKREQDAKRVREQSRKIGTLVISWDERHPAAEVVDIVRETPKAYEIRNQLTKVTAWIPKSGLRPYTPPAGMPREVGADEVVVAEWFRRTCTGLQMSVMGFAE